MLRVLRLAWHVARALAIAVAVLPFLSDTQRRVRVHRFSRDLLALLAVRVKVSGIPPRAEDLPAMIVANHISWLDIFAINTVYTTRFIAKAEIRRWPVIGWLCAQGGTLFIERTQRLHTARINEHVVAAMREGSSFTVFPEGKVTTGDGVLPFHASLLQPALACGARLFPVALRYTRVDGSLCSEADYEGEKTLLESLRLMLTQPEIHVHLQFLPPLASAGRHRRELAHEAGRAIAAALNLPAPQRRTGKVSRPPT
ncbi:MAG: lysophospholipid acyltransferase family protein [Burkholderiales bacterium]